MERITNAELDELERLEQAATPEPWYETLTGEGKVCVSHVDYSAYNGYPVCVMTNSFPQKDYPNAAFISASRNAMPRLIAEVRRLRAERDVLANHTAEEVSDCPLKLPASCGVRKK